MMLLESNAQLKLFVQRPVNKHESGAKRLATVALPVEVRDKTRNSEMLSPCEVTRYLCQVSDIHKSTHKMLLKQ